jgi:hypothetical protein
VTVTLKDLVDVCLAASAALAVNDVVPGFVGVPLSTPAALSDRPAGSAPVETVHEYGAVPPVAARVARYDVFRRAPGIEAVVIVSGAALTAIDSALVEVREAASVTLTENDDVPTAAGVPERTPAALSARPAGRDPAASDQAYGTVPPVAASEAAYVVPTAPAPRTEVVTPGGTAEAGALTEIV